MNLCDLKIGDVIDYAPLLAGGDEPVQLSVFSVESNGAHRTVRFRVLYAGIRMGSLSAVVSSSGTVWKGLSL